MCGIIGGYTEKITEGLNYLYHRGPDFQDIKQIGSIFFGHTRLSILDLDSRSNQPFKFNDLILVFNGEIWNYKQLKEILYSEGYTFSTSGDTEVLAVGLYHWGIQFLSMINGMFAVAWTQDGKSIYLARDRFGEVPLHIAKQKPFVFASEIKALKQIGINYKSLDAVPPGYYAIITQAKITKKSYYDIPIPKIKKNISLFESSNQIRELIEYGTWERLISDVPVCTLLSGGIDSAAIAYHLKQYIPNLTAYTAVFNPKSKDLKCARKVASELGISLIEVKIPLPSPDDLSHIIKIIEMDYKAQVEIAWACYIVAKKMREDGFKVVFSGEGSDELWASYGFAYHALKKNDWHQYRKELFLSQSRKNFVRCNKIFMNQSIECRLPFLSKSLVEYAIGLKKEAIQKGKSRPKAIIQDAYNKLLPNEITQRPKVAFQDGLGLKQAIMSKVIYNPKQFYTLEYNRYYANT